LQSQSAYTPEPSEYKSQFLLTDFCSQAILFHDFESAINAVQQTISTHF